MTVSVIRNTDTKHDNDKIPCNETNKKLLSNDATHDTKTRDKYS